MYDELKPFFEALLGTRSALHFGYWDEGSGMSLPEAADRLTDIIAAQAGVSSGSEVLDVGCGHGQPAVHLARSTGALVTGITVSSAQAAAAAEFALSEGLTDQVRIQVADAMRLPFPDESFDAAIALESISHMSDPVAAVTELHRVLRPGARLALADFIRRRPTTAQEHDIWSKFMPVLTQDTRATCSLQSLSELFTEASFHIVEARDITQESAVPSVSWLLSMLRANSVEITQSSKPQYLKLATDGLNAFTDYVGYALLTAEKAR
ncbi:methyltransferase domain-containing protein [Streptomyces leeuwenhoekii]|uniref:Demethylmenaquinone methyltransferase n=1 Tax=Streptomyces leeuwenhoekii TaxID=1437453 RepID=A0A0F7W0S7_STRLW|nr:methyltransferase domain-containing protein [Streptomyces leeuwenhoekii]CQR65595.1 Demethylmenaquinone methyltransferase [Streptomyces leeuwenhoekii]